MRNRERRSSAMVPLRAGLAQKLEQLPVFVVGHPEPVFGLGELALGHFGGVLLQAVEDDAPGVAEDFGHARLEARVEAEHVVVDEELAVGVRSRSEADDEALLSALGDELADAGGGHFEM